MEENNGGRKLATIRKLSKIIPINGCDNIALGMIDGWQVIIRKDEWEEGDLGIFFEIDSFIPIREDFSFLDKCKKTHADGTLGYYIKTMKMKGVLSQGLFLPLSTFDFEPKSPLWPAIHEGEDLTEKLGVKVYEKFPRGSNLKGGVIGSFPSFIPMTNEERVQNLSESTIMNEQKHYYYITEKLNGTSFTAYLKDGKFGVCSHRTEKDINDINLYSTIAKKLEIEKILRSYGDNIAIQGEIIGPGIEKNHYKLTKPALYIFNIYDINAKCYFPYRGIENICREFNLNIVPLIESGYYNDFTSEDIVKKAENSGKSRINNSCIMEGLVYNHYGLPGFLGGKTSFKVINNNYLLKE